MNFGWVADEPTSFAILDRAVEEGINFIDTADVYGGPQSPDMEQGYGLSEEIIGRWLAQDSGRRDRIVLATKLYQPMGTGPNDKYLSAYKIRRAAEDSLRRLRTDHIDLYQMHHVDRSTPWDEIWQAMEQLVREGKVTYVGSSNFAGWHIATAQQEASKRHFLGLVSEQSLYNLNARTIELELIPALRKGLRQLTAQTCDIRARLDLPGAIKSLNVSNSSPPSRSMRRRAWHSMIPKSGYRFSEKIMLHQ